MKEKALHYLSQLARGSKHSLEIFLLLLVAVIAVNSITEISNRNDYRHVLQKEITSYTAQVTKNRISDEENDDRLQMISSLEHDLFLLNTLMTTGTKDSKNTLKGSLETETETRNKAEVYFYEIQQLFAKASSDSLLALAMVTCGVLGGCLGGIREQDKLAIRSIIFGVFSGFMMFLLLKGGQSFLLVKGDGFPASFNPFSCALLALMSGLFSDATYSFAATIFKSFTSKIEKAMRQ